MWVVLDVGGCGHGGHDCMQMQIMMDTDKGNKIRKKEKAYWVQMVDMIASTCCRHK